MFQKYSTIQLERFVVAIDEVLTENLRLLFIGGSAAALAYNLKTHTKDIDIFGDSEQFHVDYHYLKTLEKSAGEKAGFLIPIDTVGVADAPYNYEDRVYLAPLSERLKRLSVYVPERHDFFLMKIMRGNEHDVQHLREIHNGGNPFEPQLLCDRFIKEMDHVALGTRELIDNFLNAVFEVFEEEEASQVENNIKHSDAGWLTRIK